MKKICVITGSRAEYGLLSRVMKLIRDDSDLLLQIIATNMHLSDKYGDTYKEIETDGFNIDRKIPILSSFDTKNSTSKSVGTAIMGFADSYEDLKPDIIMVLGDRYEIFSAVSAAVLYKIPVIHIHGGEITEGSYDNTFRHAITKMSHLHFTSTEEYRKRVIQMGEEPETVFYVGALGCDNIHQIQLLDKDTLEKILDFPLNKNTILVTFHPVTMENNTSELHFKELLSAINEFKHLKFIFTMPNSDTDNTIIMDLIKDYVSKNSDKSKWFHSLGTKQYLSTLQYIGAVVGNSSSGIIEVPSFHIPTLNIGDRQKGRISAKSVVNCASNKKEIKEKIELITSSSFMNSISNTKNPYDKPNTAQEIVKIIKSRNNITVIKKFHNLDVNI